MNSLRECAKKEMCLMNRIYAVVKFKSPPLTPQPLIGNTTFKTESFS